MQCINLVEPVHTRMPLPFSLKEWLKIYVTLFPATKKPLTRRARDSRTMPSSWARSIIIYYSVLVPRWVSTEEAQIVKLSVRVHNLNELK